MTTIRAHFDGKAIVLDEPVDLPVNKPLTLHVDVGMEAAELAETPEEINKAFDEMERLAVVTNHPVDDSRESIYSSTVDDPR